MSPAEGLIATCLWAFNFHGINMSVFWITGRTAPNRPSASRSGMAGWSADDSGRVRH